MSTIIYEGKVDQQIFNYLVRHYKVVFIPNDNHIDLPSLIIEDDRNFQIEGNRKYLKQKIFNLIEERKPELVVGKENIATIYKTIKYFLESASKIKKT